jgi:hypothetical protein
VDPVVVVILRAALALLFVSASAHKLRDPIAFRAALDGYGLLPAAPARVAARALPFAELGCAVALALPRTGVAGALLAVALLALYALAMGVNLLRGRRDLDCGCMGPGARGRIGGALVLRNAILAAAALATLLPVVPRALAWIDALTVVGAVAALAALYAASERLLAAAPALAALRAEMRA